MGTKELTIFFWRPYFSRIWMKICKLCWSNIKKRWRKVFVSFLGNFAVEIIPVQSQRFDCKKKQKEISQSLFQRGIYSQGLTKSTCFQGTYYWYPCPLSVSKELTIQINKLMKVCRVCWCKSSVKNAAAN